VEDVFHQRLTFPISRYSTQKSARVDLQEGGIYFLEALLKEGRGGDHVSVGVRLPGGIMEAPISTESLFVKPPGMSRDLQYF
jgi:hypothetical protein